MSKINLHPTDRIATFQEVFKQIGMVTGVLLIFIFVFFIPMSQGMATSQTCDDITLECVEGEQGDFLSVAAGYALSGCFLLILIAIWSQVFMVIIGKGKFVIDENNSVTLRTSKSGTRKPGRLLTAPRGSSLTEKTAIITVKPAIIEILLLARHIVAAFRVVSSSFLM